MRTTLDIPDALFKEVKTRAVQQGVTLKELLAGYIEAGLKGPLSNDSPTTPSLAKQHPLPVGIPRQAGTPLHPAMTNAELYAILEEEDFANYYRVIEQAKPKI